MDPGVYKGCAGCARFIIIAAILALIGLGVLIGRLSSGNNNNNNNQPQAPVPTPVK